MDNTLAQIINHTFELEIENIQLKQRIDELESSTAVLPAGTDMPVEVDQQG